MELLLKAMAEAIQGALQMQLVLLSNLLLSGGALKVWQWTSVQNRLAD